MSRELFANSAAYPRMRAWKCERVGPIEDKLFLFGGVPGSIYPRNLSSRRFLGTFSLREGSGERSNRTKGSYSSFEMFNLCLILIRTFRVGPADKNPLSTSRHRPEFLTQFDHPSKRTKACL